jgi:hypothetical protein
MVDDPRADFPNPPIEVVEDEDTTRNIVEAHLFSYMSETQANAMIGVAKNRYAVPARHETIRYCCALIFAAVVLIYLLPALLARNPSPQLLTLVILGVLGILSADRVIKAVLNAIG